MIHRDLNLTFDIFETVVLSESVPDVDKVLLNVEAKEFTMERPTLQSLQQLIQWVADLALNILAKLPESRSFMSNKSQGVSFAVLKVTQPK